MWCPACPRIVLSEDCGDRRWRTTAALLLVWVGQRATTDAHQHAVPGAESPVRAEPRLEHLTTVELEREQLVVPEEGAGDDGRGRALVRIWGRNWGEAKHLGAQHHVHSTLERAVQRDFAEYGSGASSRCLPRHKLDVADEVGDRPA